MQPSRGPPCPPYIRSETSVTISSGDAQAKQLYMRPSSSLPWGPMSPALAIVCALEFMLSLLHLLGPSPTGQTCHYFARIYRLSNASGSPPARDCLDTRCCLRNTGLPDGNLHNASLPVPTGARQATQFGPSQHDPAPANQAAWLLCSRALDTERVCVNQTTQRRPVKS